MRLLESPQLIERRTLWYQGLKDSLTREARVGERAMHAAEHELRELYRC